MSANNFRMIASSNEATTMSSSLAARSGTSISGDRANSHAVDEIAFGMIIFGLAFAPFWFGGNRPLAWGLNAVWSSATAIVYEAGRLLGGRRHPIALRRIGLPVAGVMLVSAWAGLQMSAGTPEGYQHPVWQMAREALGRDLRGAISINPDETMMAILKLATTGCLFWTTMQLCRSPKRSRILISAVAAVGALYALYGIIAFFVFPDTILWYRKLIYNQVVTSTFIDRNSYGTYAGLGLMAAIGMSVSQFVAGDRAGGRSMRRRIAGAMASATGPGGIWLASVLVIGVALVLTAARGGITATFGGIVALAAMTGIRSRRNKVGLGFGLLIALAIIGAAAFAYGDTFAERIANQGFESEDRLAVYRLALLSIVDAPLFGSGWGTFREVLPMYRDSSLGPFGVWEFARNSYLELFQGLGLPSAAVLLISILLLVGRTVYGALARRHSATVPMVATAATFVVFLEAFVDFGIQMQAVTLTWTALLAAGVAQSWSARAVTDR